MILVQKIFLVISGSFSDGFQQHRLLSYDVLACIKEFIGSGRCDNIQIPSSSIGHGGTRTFSIFLICKFFLTFAIIP